MDWNQIRADFPMLKQRIIYLDNAATSFKPTRVIDAVNAYLSTYSANAYRGDYDLSAQVDQECEKVRDQVAAFLHANRKEIVFTSGASASLNLLAYSLGLCQLQAGDEIIITQAEHASNILPWFNVAQKTGAVVHYLELDPGGRVNPENLRKIINQRTRIVSIAHVTNVLGFLVDIKALSNITKDYPDCRLIVDAAQSAPHFPLDVQELGCDFLLFSAHKMCGPTGVGILYGKYQHLEKMEPLFLGGGMNSRYDTCGNILFLDPPRKFEAGTPNIAGIIGLGAALSYLQDIGMDKIQKREEELYSYLMKKLGELGNVVVYNPAAEGSILTFNIKGVYAEDAAAFYNKKKICVRAGQHCAKILMDYLKTTSTLRLSLYFYNNEAEIDAFIAATKEIGSFTDLYFYDRQDDVRELLQRHATQPLNFGLTGRGKQTEVAVASCNDHYQLEVVVEDEVIKDIAFQGQGCAISMAAFSLITSRVLGEKRETARKICEQLQLLMASGEGDRQLLGSLLALAKIRQTPNRVKCALLPAEALLSLLN